MTDDRWPQIKQILDAALDREPSERESYLDQACAGDAELHSAVESLLAAGDTPCGFMEPPVQGVAHSLLSGRGTQLPLGQRIGPYRLVELIATGGMGTVYRAVRVDDEYEKQVAIKLIRPDAVSAEALRRFRQERQALSGFDHPNIARMLDGGTTEEGLPYLVMEFVEGKPIDRYCDERALSIAARLQLFRQVCGAVHYAHQNLVVHRDLKPRNILVGPDGQPKLLDFGISKWLDMHAAVATDPTVTMFRVLTPQYASPEQTRGAAITTASDVYSLGVILYELLAGHRPYHIPRDQHHEATRIICEGEPDTPSEAITSIEEIDLPDGTTSTITPELVSKMRGEPPERLRRRLRGDLDTIVMTAMHKDPGRRYSTVEQLSEDIRRYLAGLPVLARRDTLTYRVGKFIRRNKVASVAVVVAILSLIGGTIGTSVGMIRAQAARQRAVEEAHKATIEARKAERISEFLQNMLASADPEKKGKDVTVREILDEAAKQIDTELADEPRVRAALSNAIGLTYLGLGAYEQAEFHLQSAFELRDSLPTCDDIERVESLDNLGTLKYERGEYAAAGVLFEQALELLERARGPDHPDSMGTLNNLAVVKQTMGDHRAAEQLQRKVLRVRRKALGNDHIDLAVTLQNLGYVLSQQGQYAPAERFYREALELRERHYGENHVLVAMTLNNLAVLLKNKGEFDEAEQMYRRALAIRLKTLGPDHPLVATTLHNLGGLFYAKGDYEAAEENIREALEIRRKAFGAYHANIATSLEGLGILAQANQKYSEAKELHQEALEMRRTLFGDRHQTVAKSYSHIGRALRAAGELEEAARVMSRALEILRDLFGENHPLVIDTLTSLGKTRFQQGDYETAERLFKECLSAAEAVLGRESPSRLTCLNNLSAVYSAQGKLSKAEDNYREALSLHRHVYGNDDPHVADTMLNLAALLHETERRTEAEQLCRSAIEIQRAMQVAPDLFLSGALTLCAEVLIAQQRHDDAEPLLLEALAIRERALPEGAWQIADTRSILGECTMRRGDLDKAELGHRRIPRPL